VQLFKAVGCSSVLLAVIEDLMQSRWRL